ncbi:MAG: hypothetical protein K8R35_00585, partial [Bacteroidales bacterium]|nr:hypothetical protein [Bacteroidales bacterium]
VGLPVLAGIGDTDRGTVMIGLIYFTIYLLTSFASRSSGVFTRRIGSHAKGLNITMLTIFLFGIATGVLYHYSVEFIAIILFVFIYATENIRRPVAIAKIASDTEAGSLTTYLSVDSQLKSLFTMILSPVIGLIADLVSPGAGIAIVGAILLISSLFVRVND